VAATGERIELALSLPAAVSDPLDDAARALSTPVADSPREESSAESPLVRALDTMPAANPPKLLEPPEERPAQAPFPSSDGGGGAATETPVSPAPLERREVRVSKGDSLYLIFRRLGLSQADMLSAVRADKLSRDLTRLRPGQRLVITTDLQGSVQALAQERRDGRALLVQRREGTFASSIVDWEATRDADDPEQDTEGTAAAESRPEARPRIAARPEDLAGGPPRLQAAAMATDTDDPDFVRLALTVVRGDSLYRIFKKRGLRVSDLPALLAAGSASEGLRRLRPGQSIELHVDDAGAVARLIVSLDEIRALHVERGPNGYGERIVETPIERREVVASGVIESSLFLSGQRAGLSDRTIMEMAEVFGWDVDFVLDIRAGDRFSLIHEELYKGGEKLRDGPILAAEFVNQGRMLRAVRYVDPEGRAEYFSPDGKSMRKAFLRTPVNFSRISSRFSRGRKHPVLHRIRAHRGVDYAAPTGTPVRAAGDGKVELAGRKGGYGKTIVLQHGSARTTLYAHLSRYARGMKRGRRVRQGQVIGYVGATGLASGPHLHYEFRIRGVHKDPLRLKLPSAAPIAEAYARDFATKSAPLLARLETASRTVIAAARD
jgi:murein DD-endopeptidase MepM/ murein hydrolase activator NlpD